MTRSAENCRSCGGAWFGAVAYCPYCGRASASEPVASALPEPPAPAAPAAASASVPAAPLAPPAPAEPAAPAGAADSWLSWAKPLFAGTVLGVLLVVVGVLLLRAFGHSP